MSDTTGEMQATETNWAHANRQLPPTPLAGIDLNSGYMPVRRIFYFAGEPDVAQIQRSLSAALAQWPDFAGTIAMCDGIVSLYRNDTGVRFTVDKRNEPVPAFGIDHPSGLPTSYCDESIGEKTGDGAPVFTVKLTCYNDSHWVLGTCNSHALCDGSGYWQFMQSWIDAFHGKTLHAIGSDFIRYTGSTACQQEGLTPPTLKVPASPLAPQQMANLASYRTAQMLITEQQLEQLKKTVNVALAPQWVSTTDALMALLWQCLARLSLAQHESTEQEFPLANVINIRPRLQLPHYTGNMAFSVISHATLGEISDMPLAQLALQLRQDSQKLPEKNIHQFLDFLQQQLQQGHYNSRGYFNGFSASMAEACVHGKGIMVNNWSKFPAYDIDFSGAPLWFDLATVIPMHFAMVMPAKNGIVLRLFLPDGLLAETCTLLQKSLQQAAISPA